VNTRREVEVRIAVVGGGGVGTALALAGVGRGHAVVQLERVAEPRAAGVRDFGLVWICGAAGRELDLALAGRAACEAVAARVPAVGFRACGALGGNPGQIVRRWSGTYPRRSTACIPT
jgi:hypothetical protein